MPYSEYLRVLEVVGKRESPSLSVYNLVCETGDWLDSAVLKIQKPGWTQKRGEGIFFSIWVQGNDLNRFHYNIHALKHRLWKSHEIKPGEFAKAFRTAFAPLCAEWPNIRTDFGPQTLMRGWEPLRILTFEKQVTQAIRRFVPLHTLIDELLDARRK